MMSRNLCKSKFLEMLAGIFKKSFYSVLTSPHCYQFVIVTQCTEKKTFLTCIYKLATFTHPYCVSFLAVIFLGPQKALWRIPHLPVFYFSKATIKVNTIRFSWRCLRCFFCLLVLSFSHCPVLLHFYNILQSFWWSIPPSDAHKHSYLRHHTVTWSSPPTLTPCSHIFFVRFSTLLKPV